MSTFTRASKATYINKQGVLVEAGIDEPRFEKEGILIEGASTNTLTQSLPDSSWGVVSVDIINSGEIISGIPVVRLVSSAEPETNCIYSEGTVIKGKQYTLSVFCKGALKLSADPRFTGGFSSISVGEDGTVLSVSDDVDYWGVTNLADGLYRAWVTVTAKESSEGRTILIYPREAKELGDFNTVGGAQVEELPFASSYIPTNGTPVTRASDMVDIDGLKQTSSDNTLYAVLSPIGSKSSYADIVSNLMPNYRIEYTSSEAKYVSVYRATNQVGEEHSQIGSRIVDDYSLQDAWPMAVVSKGESFSTYANGSFVASSVGSIPPLEGGYVTLGGEGTAFFHIRDLRVWNHALTAEQIATL